MRRFVASILPLGTLACPGIVLADDFDEAGAAWSERPAVAMVGPLTPAFVTHSYGGTSGAFGRIPYGFFLAADGGVSFFPAAGKWPLEAKASFQVRAGYEWPNGLALEGCFDD